MENKMTFHGTGREFFGIWIVNVVLSLLTLGIYSAWAKVRTKKYFYGNTELAGDRFDYHATPKQILIGRAIAVAALVIWIVVGQFFPLFSGVLFLAGLLVLPWLTRNNARFDARMTSYRNVRLNFTGSLLGAYAAILGRGALIVLMFIALVAFATAQTNGFVTFVFILGGFVAGFVMFAWLMKGIASYFANGYGYGRLSFQAELSTGFYIRTYLGAMLLGFLVSIGTGILSAIVVAIAELFVPIPLTLGDVDMENISISDLGGVLNLASVMILTYATMFASFLVVSAYVVSRTRNHVFSRMQVGETGDYRLRSEMRARDYAWLVVSNFFLQVFTLGLARPWVQVRTTRYLLSVTTIHGDLDALSVYEDENGAKSAVGDEMSQVFDLDIGIN